jgi:hypothetical protein
MKQVIYLVRELFQSYWGEKWALGNVLYFVRQQLGVPIRSVLYEVWDTIFNEIEDLYPDPDILIARVRPTGRRN